MKVASHDGDSVTQAGSRHGPAPSLLAFAQRRPHCFRDEQHRETHGGDLLRERQPDGCAGGQPLYPDLGDATRPASFHFALGTRLSPLRDEGVLIAASGNVVHNLRMMGRDGGAPCDWAVRFDEYVRDALTTRQYDRLIEYHQAGEDAGLAVPTPEHYLPLLYVLGL